jgi:hypothetical protein
MKTVFTARKRFASHNDEDFLPVCFSLEEIKKAIVALELKDFEYTNDMFTEHISKVFIPAYDIYQAYVKDNDSDDYVFEKAFI